MTSDQSVMHSNNVPAINETAPSSQQQSNSKAISQSSGMVSSASGGGAANSGKKPGAAVSASANFKKNFAGDGNSN